MFNNEMETASQSHMNWGSGPNILNNSTTMIATDCNVAPLDYYKRLLLDEDMTLLPSDGTQVDLANVLQNFQDDLEQLEWECAPEQNCSWEPAEHQAWVSMVEELQCPPTSETISVESPTVDQSSEESPETGGEHDFGQSTESVESGGDCSDGHIDNEATSPPVLSSGNKIGVTFHKKNKQWEAHLWVKGQQLRGRKKKGVQIFLGNFETEEEAKVAHDRAAIKLGIPPSARGGEPYPLNFPAAAHANYMEEHAHWTARDFLWKIRRTSNKFSKGKSSLKGVTVRKRSVKRGEEWAATYQSKLSLTAKEFGDDMKRTFELGNFESEEEAGQAYDRALLFLHQHLPEVEQLRYITNYRPSSYSAEDIEAMASKLPRLATTKDDRSSAAASILH